MPSPPPDLVKPGRVAESSGEDSAARGSFPPWVLPDAVIAEGA